MALFNYLKFKIMTAPVYVLVNLVLKIYYFMTVPFIKPAFYQNALIALLAPYASNLFYVIFEDFFGGFCTK
jgi:hypothetical protein